MPDGDDISPEFSSPACLLHEIDPAYAGLAPSSPPEGVPAWRKARREELIAARLTIPADTRAAHSEAIADALDRELDRLEGKAVSLYWPFRGEPDLRPWMERISAGGATCLLPIVVEKGKPLIFKSRSLIAESGISRFRLRAARCCPTLSSHLSSVSTLAYSASVTAAAFSTARWPPIPASRW